jgi:hypothetical protein
MTEFIRGAWTAERMTLTPAARNTASNAAVKLVPLEYSIEWLTCAIASRLDVLMVGLPGAAQDRLLAYVPVPPGNSIASLSCRFA